MYDFKPRPFTGFCIPGIFEFPQVTVLDHEPRRGVEVESREWSSSDPGGTRLELLSQVRLKLAIAKGLHKNTSLDLSGEILGLQMLQTEIRTKMDADSDQQYGILSYSQGIKRAVVKLDFKDRNPNKDRFEGARFALYDPPLITNVTHTEPYKLDGGHWVTVGEMVELKAKKSFDKWALYEKEKWAILPDSKQNNISGKPVGDHKIQVTGRRPSEKKNDAGVELEKWAMWVDCEQVTQDDYDMGAITYWLTVYGMGALRFPDRDTQKDEPLVIRKGEAVKLKAIPAPNLDGAFPPGYPKWTIIDPDGNKREEAEGQETIRRTFGDTGKYEVVARCGSAAEKYEEYSVKRRTIYVVKADIARPSGEPDKPGEAAPGTNEFSFGSNARCNIPCKAKLTPDNKWTREWAEENLEWSITTETGTQAGKTQTWIDTDDDTEDDNTGASVKLLLEGLGETNKAFGQRKIKLTVAASDGMKKKTMETPIEIFYPPDATNHPDTRPKGANWVSNKNMSTPIKDLPNWFYYWSQTAAAKGKQIVKFNYEKNPGKNKKNIASDFMGVCPVDITIKIGGGDAYGVIKGVDYPIIGKKAGGRSFFGVSMAAPKVRVRAVIKKGKYVDVRVEALDQKNEWKEIDPIKKGGWWSQPVFKTQETVEGIDLFHLVLLHESKHCLQMKPKKKTPVKDSDIDGIYDDGELSLNKIKKPKNKWTHRRIYKEGQVCPAVLNTHGAYTPSDSSDEEYCAFLAEANNMNRIGNFDNFDWSKGGKQWGK